MRKVENVLSAWELVEYLSAGELPSDKDLKSNQRLNVLSTERKQLGSELGTLTGDKKTIVYLNCFTNYDLQLFLRHYYKNDNVGLDEDTCKRYSASIEIDTNLQYIEGSLVIPHMMLLLKRINETTLDQTMSFQEITASYQESYLFVEQEIRDCFSKREVAISEVIHSVELLLMNYFNLKNLNLKYPVVSYTLAGVTDRDKPTDLNSFYLKDLKKIKKDGINPRLFKFIKGIEQHHDIDDNRDTLMPLIHPNELPLGRWPSEIPFKLNLMQQVAVNLAVDLKDDIFSVNVPTGTGKVTLIKDIIADLIVQRAFKMVGLAKPTDGFIARNALDVSDETLLPKKLAPNLIGYGVTVASSNNPTVETIIKKLPLTNKMAHSVSSFENEPTYQELLKELDYFSEYSDIINQTESGSHWGLFSFDFGNKNKVDTVLTTLIEGGKQGELPSLSSTMRLFFNDDSKKVKTWEQVKSEFMETIVEIENEQAKILKYKKAILSLEQTQVAYLAAVKHYEEKSELVDKASTALKEALITAEQAKVVVDNLPLDSMIQKMKHRLFGKEKAENIKARKALYYANQEVIIKKESLKTSKALLEEAAKDQEATESPIPALEQAVKEGKAYFDATNKITVGDDSYWSKDNYAERQRETPWVSDKLNYYRGTLFIKALQVHKYFNAANQDQIEQALQILSKRYEFDRSKSANQELLIDCFNILQLVVPVISITFESIGELYQELGKGSIENLIINDAGQISPQQAVGAIQRSLNVMTLGDSAQLKPIQTLDDMIVNNLSQAFDLEEKYVGRSASVQRLADEANAYGTYKQDGTYIGTPLWVNRRLKEPMFSVVNELSYENKMVLAEEEPIKTTGEAYWVNVKGSVIQEQFVPEYANVLVEYLSTEVAIKDVFVISPFKSVSDNLKQLLGKGQYQLPNIPSDILIKWKQTNIGTAQTFQEKEAKVVYFVCGTDTKSDKSPNWVSEEAAIINTAMTCAKEKFIIIGDRQSLKEKPHYNIVDNYTKSLASSYNK